MGSAGSFKELIRKRDRRRGNLPGPDIVEIGDGQRSQLPTTPENLNLNLYLLYIRYVPRVQSPESRVQRPS